MNAEKWTGIILAGGLSSRMGTNKALLELNGSTVLNHMVKAIRPAVSRIVVAAGSNEALYSVWGDEGLECIQDVYPGKGPLAGLHAALSASRTDWNLVSACDMPLLQTSFQWNEDHLRAVSNKRCHRSSCRRTYSSTCRSLSQACTSRARAVPNT